MMSKDEQRLALETVIASYETSAKAIWDNIICEKLISHLQLHPHFTIGFYWPLVDEINIQPVWQNTPHTIALPTTSPKDPHYRLWDQNPQNLDTSKRIYVPIDTSPVAIPDIIIVPMLGFSEDGYRLGHGGGFYDRWLAQHPDTISIGVAWDIQKCVLIPEPHDIPMTMVMTEKRIYGLK